MSSISSTSRSSAAGWLGYRRGGPAAMLLTALLLVGLAVSDSRPERVLRHQLFDLYQQLLPRERLSDSVVVIGIDDLSLAEIGQWPWPRSKLAALVSRVADLQPAAIGLDMLFTEPDRYSPKRLEQDLIAEGVIPNMGGQRLPDYDQRLADSLKRAGAIIGVAGVHRDERFKEGVGYRPPIRQNDPDVDVADFVWSIGGSLRSIDVIDRAAGGRGIINSVPQLPAEDGDTRKRQDDGVVRQVPAMAMAGTSLLPGFAVEILRQISDDPVLNVSVDGRGLRGVDIADRLIPTDRDGAWWIHYSDPRERPPISALGFVTGRFPAGVDPSFITGRVVLIGSTSSGLGDLVTTPLGVVPGVSVHAEAIDNYFDNRMLSRPRWAQASELLLCAALSLIGILAVPALQPLRAALLFTVSSLVVAGSGFAAFELQGWLLDVATPAIAAGFVFGFMVLVALTHVEAQRQRVEHQRQTLHDELEVSREQSARIEGELNAARRIQSGMLPNPRTVLGDDRRIDLAALMDPAREVGGDLYDFFLVDGSRLFFMIGDVSGKGLPASLFMSLSKALIKGAALHSGDAPGRSLSAAGRVIARENPESMFVTVTAGVLDLDTGAWAWCSAGHDSPYLLRAATRDVQLLETSGGPPLCMVEAFDYPSERGRLAPGDVICLVTDGVTEAHNRRGELYGSERLSACLAANRDQPSGKLVERLRKDVARFTEGLELADDLSILVLRWKGGGQA